MNLEIGKTYETLWITTRAKSQLTVQIISYNYANLKYKCNVFITGIFNTEAEIDSNLRLFIDGMDTLLDVIIEESVQLPLGYQRICDCGGYKTYNEWGKEYHSSWCKVNML